MSTPELFEVPPRLMGAVKKSLSRERIAKLTEKDMISLLDQRYATDYGNGQRYVCAHHVRSHAGFDARRTADFIAYDTWASRLEVHGHEVKVSRADWLAELKQPEKAGEFLPYMHYWWLVISDASYVREGELPDGWGLMAVRGEALRVVKKAPYRAAIPLSPTRVAALLRAVVKTNLTT